MHGSSHATDRPPAGTRAGHLRDRDRLCIGALLILLSLSFVGYGAFASFTSTSVASGSVATGSIVLALGATGGSTNRLDVDAAGLAPGDSFQRSFDLLNRGTLDLSAVTLTTTATASSTLDTDAANGLQIEIDRCSTAWSESGVSPAFSYTCPGSTAPVLNSSPVIQTDAALANLSSLAAGADDHLLLTIALPASAGNSMQSKSSTIQYAFTGAH